jgi:hypothetical protein
MAGSVLVLNLRVLLPESEYVVRITEGCNWLRIVSSDVLLVLLVLK